MNIFLLFINEINVESFGALSLSSTNPPHFHRSHWMRVHFDNQKILKNDNPERNLCLTHALGLFERWVEKNLLCSVVRLFFETEVGNTS